MKFEIQPVQFAIDWGGVTVKLFATFNLAYDTEEDAIKAFTNTWRNAVEPMREKATEISRLYKDGI